MRRWLSALALFVLPLLSSCATSKPGLPHELILKLLPPTLAPGEIIEVQALPRPMASMRWISGTVEVMGAPTMPFVPGPDGNWIFKTQIPVFATIQPGAYRAKAWGEDSEGQRYEGSLVVQVK